MPKSRRKKARKLKVRDNIDRISKLPDEVLCRILSHLQTKEAVATSILSKRWEDVWTSTPSLEFSDDVLFNHCRDLETKTGMFKAFVDNVLFHHGWSGIEKCSISCQTENASAYLYAWICAIVCCGVQEFTLESSVFSDEFDPCRNLPWSMFTCKTLVYLKIKGAFLLDLPSYLFLPKLKTIHLSSVVSVDDASVEKLFSNCPCLEELHIERNNGGGMHNLNISSPSLKRLSIILLYYHDGQGERETKINTPNLEYLTLKDSNCKVYFVHPSPSLIEARISFNCAYETLQGIQNVRLLALCGRIMRAHHNIDLPKFEHLSRLELGVDHTYVDWRLLPRLLENAPNLEVLVFPEGLVNRKNTRVTRRFYWASPEHVPECLLFKLKTVEIQKFVGVPGEVHLVKFLLESSKVLERMAIHCYDFFKKKQWKANRNLVTALNEIANVPRVSEECEVEFFSMKE